MDRSSPHVSRPCFAPLNSQRSCSGGAQPSCRSSAFPSRSRTTSTSPACRPPPPAPQFAYTAAETATVVSAARRRRDRSSARPTWTSSPPAWSARARLRRLLQRLRRATTSAAARARARPSRSPRPGRASRSAPTPPAPAACPPAFNNIVGLKPTRGLLSTHGVVPACRTLDCVSIFAGTARDAALVLTAARGLDEKDSYSREPQVGAGAAPWSYIQPKPSASVCLPPASLSSSETPTTSRSFSGRRSSRARRPARGVRPAALLATAQLLYQGPWVAERYAAIATFMRQPTRCR